VPRALAETTALLLLAATLAFAVMRPGGLPGALVAVPAALLTVALGILPLPAALDELRGLGPTVAFLAAVLVLAELCDREGLFEAAGRWMAASSRGRPGALLALVFVVGSVVTAALSLDATVVLLTPVVFATVARLRLRAKPHSTPALIWRTRPRCCCRSPTSPTCWPSGPAGCRSPASRP
jgi:arsenical pump membrane protein